jgi:hypothetical protein
VARAFTKDAQAQAANDGRITLLVATERDPATTPMPEGFHITEPSGGSSSVTFHAKGSRGEHLTTIPTNQKIKFVGKECVLDEYLDEWYQQLYARRLLTFDSAPLDAGVYFVDAIEERSFNTGECFVDGREMDSATLEAKFGVRIVRPSIASDYEISTRGRVLRLAPVTVGGVSMQIMFTETE